MATVKRARIPKGGRRVLASDHPARCGRIGPPARRIRLLPTRVVPEHHHHRSALDEALERTEAPLTIESGASCLLDIANEGCPSTGELLAAYPSPRRAPLERTPTYVQRRSRPRCRASRRRSSWRRRNSLSSRPASFGHDRKRAAMRASRVALWSTRSSSSNAPRSGGSSFIPAPLVPAMQVAKPHSATRDRLLSPRERLLPRNPPAGSRARIERSSRRGRCRRAGQSSRRQRRPTPWTCRSGD